MVVAIDFGTSRSGFAYSWTGAATRETHFRDKWDDQPPGSSYPKNATVSLYDASDRLVKWGHSAARLVAESTALEGFALAREFKMDLRTAPRLGGSPVKTMDERRGNQARTFKVVKLIADYLRELKALALDDIRKATVKSFLEKDILWCLTIPADWSDAEKGWMRLAAQEAGVISSAAADQERLLFALEPEAAALHVMEKQQLELKEGDRFMILDCGGGTIDITVHRKEGNALRALADGVGANYGSTYVNKEFVEFLKQQVSEEAFRKWCELDPRESGDMIRNKIENAKCAFGLAPKDPVYLELPAKLYTFLEHNYPGRLDALEQLYGDSTRLKLSPDTMAAKVFGRVVDGVIETVNTAMRGIRPGVADGKLLDYIFMVGGGFSESIYLQEQIAKCFGHLCNRIVVPDKPGSAVLLGAVSFALNPSLIRSRRSRLTYGTCHLTPFVESEHHGREKVWSPTHRKHYCRFFSPFCYAGEEIGLEDVKIERTGPLEADQTNIGLAIYATKRTDAKYVDDPGVEPIATLKVEMPDITGGTDRLVEVRYQFAGTEVSVSAKDVNSGKTYATRIDFSSSYSADYSS
jgi:hypothetical protein